MIGFEDLSLRERLGWLARRWRGRVFGLAVFGLMGGCSLPVVVRVGDWLDVVWCVLACGVWGGLVWFLVSDWTDWTTPPLVSGVKMVREYGSGGRTDPPLIPPEGGRDWRLDELYENLNEEELGEVESRS